MIKALIYRFVVYLGIIAGGFYKIHQLWIAEMAIDPVKSAAKILLIVLILWVLFTPAELLQGEDR